MASPILNRKITAYAVKLKKAKKFPAFASGCEFNNFKKIAHSGDIEAKDFVHSLKLELETFGNIGKKYFGSSIGFCAETVSANRVLTKYPSQRNRIQVGIALRPRTMQHGKKCKICNSLFP